MVTLHISLPSLMILLFILSAILDLGKMFILPRGDEIIANTSSKTYIFLKLNKYIQPLQATPTKFSSSLHLVL